MTISLQKIFACVLLAVVFGSQTITGDDFLGLGLTDDADIGILAGAAVLIIIVVVVISVSIYCYRKRAKQNEAPSNNGQIYPEQEDVRAWPMLNGTDQLPKMPTSDLPRLPPEQITPTDQQQSRKMPTQSQLQQQLLPITQFPTQMTNPQFPPSEPLETQPYFGALQSSLEPYLAQDAIAKELARKGEHSKGKKSKKNKNKDIEPEKPFSIYDHQPIVAHNQSTPYQQTSHQIMSEPPSANNHPEGYRSFLPHVATPSNPPSPLPNMRSDYNPASNIPVQKPQPIYSLSQRVDYPSTQQPSQQTFNQDSNSMQQLPSGRRLNRISAYDYMLH